MPVDDTLPLFTPKGEEAWVPGWAPDYISPSSGETGWDVIFTTGEGAETTWWTCLYWEPERWRVRHMRLTPSSRIAFVEVRCAPEGAACTRLSASYDILSRR